MARYVVIDQNQAVRLNLSLAEAFVFAFLNNYRDSSFGILELAENVPLLTVEMIADALADLKQKRLIVHDAANFKVDVDAL